MESVTEWGREIGKGQLEVSFELVVNIEVS